MPVVTFTESCVACQTQSDLSQLTMYRRQGYFHLHPLTTSRYWWGRKNHEQIQKDLRFVRWVSEMRCATCGPPLPPEPPRPEWILIH